MREVEDRHTKTGRLTKEQRKKKKKFVTKTERGRLGKRYTPVS